MTTKLINILSTVEWRILIPSVGLATAIPEVNPIIRFLIPIASGIVWVFLKPQIVKLRDKKSIKMKKKFREFKKEIKGLTFNSKFWLVAILVVFWFATVFITSKFS